MYDIGDITPAELNAALVGFKSNVIPTFSSRPGRIGSGHLLEVLRERRGTKEELIELACCLHLFRDSFRTWNDEKYQGLIPLLEQLEKKVLTSFEKGK